MSVWIIEKIVPSTRYCDDVSHKKRFVEKYLCWLPYREPYVPYETMLERIVGSTSTSSNIYEVIDDNQWRQWE